MSWMCGRKTPAVPASAFILSRHWLLLRRKSRTQTETTAAVTKSTVVTFHTHQSCKNSTQLRRGVGDSGEDRDGGGGGDDDDDDYDEKFEL